MENLLDTNVESSQNLQLDASSIGHLNETRKWTFFISIVVFILMGLAIIILVGVILFSGSFGSGMYSVASPALALMPLLLIMAVYFFPFYFLYMFSKNAKSAVQNLDPNSLNTAFKYLKFHYRYMGILFIIIISIYIFVFLGALIFGGLASLLR